MLADVLNRNRLKLRWAQWRFCLCHEASSLAISCHFLQAQALGAELDFVHRIGFGLAAFVFHGFQAACFRFRFHPVQHAAEYPASPRTHALPAQSARPCTFPARPNLPAHTTLFPAWSNSSPLTPARYESTHIDAGRRCSVAGRKRESGAYPELPFGFRLKIRPFP